MSERCRCGDLLQGACGVDDGTVPLGVLEEDVRDVTGGVEPLGCDQCPSHSVLDGARVLGFCEVGIRCEGERG